jgi:hypothetical protein
MEAQGLRYVAWLLRSARVMLGNLPFSPFDK